MTTRIKRLTGAALTATIVRLLQECEAGAWREGWRGERYEPTAEDLAFVTGELGFLPRRTEWADAGLPDIGGRHVADG